MAADYQPDVRESGGDSLFLLRSKVSGKDDEISFPTHLRQNIAESLDKIDRGDTYKIFRMRGRYDFFGRDTDNAKPDSFHVYDFVFLYLGNGGDKIRRQQRKSGFT